MSILEDIQRRSAHIHWPEGIVPEQADLFAHNDIVIAASAGEIWVHLIHAAAWPNWYSNASGVTVNDPSRLLGPGVTFDWVTFGAHIHSTVHEFEPTARIGWYGETDQWLAYHTWLLEPRDERTTYVVMEETGTGANQKNSPTRIPATCTAVTICGTSASSSSAKARRASGGRRRGSRLGQCSGIHLEAGVSRRSWLHGRYGVARRRRNRRSR